MAQSPPSRHRCLLVKMTRARIAARSAEQIEPTDALLAGKAQRKAGSSRHRQKTRQFLLAQASCRDPGTRLELCSHRHSSNANSLCSRNSAGSLEICATFQWIICAAVSEFESYMPSHAVASLWARQASWIELQFKSPLGPWSERASSSGATFAMISANCVAGRDQGRGIACAFGMPVHWGCNDSVVADYRRIPSGSRGGERAGARLGAL